MNNETLSDIIEKLALNIVLIDHTEIDEIEENLPLFSQIAGWAKDNSQPVLFNASEACTRLLERIIDESEPSPEESFAIISRAVSEIQRNARDEFNFMSMSLPDALCMKALPNTKTTETSVQENSHRAAGDLRHPTSLPGHLDKELFTEFLRLQPENLDKMEALILAIEEQSDEHSTIELKQMIHTMKGEAGFLNLDEIETVCHLTEDVLEEDSPADYTDVFFNTIDWMRKTFAWYAGGEKKPESSAPLIEAIKNHNRGEHLRRADVSGKTDVSLKEREEEITGTLEKNRSDLSHATDFYTAFISRLDSSINASKKFILKLLPMIEDLEANDDRPSKKLQQGILKLQYYITKISAVADFISLNEIALLTRNTHTLLDKMLGDATVCKPDVVGLIQDAFDALKKQTRNLEAAMAETRQIDYGEELPGLIARLQMASSGGVTENTNNTRINALSPRASTDSKRSEKPAKSLFPPPPTGVMPATASHLKKSINVDAERLDKIIDMIGELVIAESMIIQAEEIRNINSQELTRHLNQMGKITRDLQETSLSLRMLPIKSTFQKMARIARDTARKSGKEIKFIMQGEDTELDKTVVDKIGDPLLHMVRNAIDHGIEETEEERNKVNKPTYGTVKLRAFHKGGSILIEIEDDGKGLDTKSILNKAIERNMIEEGDELTKHEIYNLIFEPGFSTASEITDLSGRGVGMNVVKSFIEALHGQVEITSEKGRGSIFTIKIPLTLAIIDGMVVRVHGERYIIPTLSIITSNPIDKTVVTSVFNQGEMVDIHGQLVPLFRLSSLFMTGSGENTSSQSLLVVVEEDGKQAAIVVDELLGKQQIVIKTLGESLKNIPGISGGAIMPDGRVGLIIDVAGLIRLAHR